jgi:hypothetical protein
MDIGRIGGTGSRAEDVSTARQIAAQGPGPAGKAGAQAKGDRVELSTDGQLARRALDAVRGMLSTPGADPAELRMIQDRLEDRYYDRPQVTIELADRVGGMLDLAGA